MGRYLFAAVAIALSPFVVATGAIAQVSSAPPSSSSRVDLPTVRNCTLNSDDRITLNADPREFNAIVGVVDCWEATVDNDRLYYLNDLYARWVVEQIPLPAGSDLSRVYRQERRSPLARLFVGKSRGVVVTVKLKMRDPDVEFTLPLLSIDYDGRAGRGEAFVTSLTSSEMGLTDFRISPNSSVSVEAVARVTDNVDVRTTGLVLKTLQEALGLASSTGSLLTSINREQVQRTAVAYDSAVSRLLSTTTAESASASRVLSEWYPGASMLISVDVPDTVHTTGIGGSRRLYFKLSMTCPRLSVFDATIACQTGLRERPSTNMRRLINSPYQQPTNDRDRSAIGEPGFDSNEYRIAVGDMATRISAHQVLGFRLGMGKTMRQFLSEQEWFISLSKKLVSPVKEEQKAVDQATNGGTVAAIPTGEPGPTGRVQGTSSGKPDTSSRASANAAADEFCEAIVDKLYAAGLSHLDAEIGLWAVVTGMPDFASSRAFFLSAQGCLHHRPGPNWAYAATPDRTGDGQSNTQQ